MTDGSVSEFLSRPVSLDDPMFKPVANVLDTLGKEMGKDPNAINKGIEAFGQAVMQASEKFSASPERERGHLIGETMFGMVNLEGSTEAAEAAGKIASSVAAHVDKVVIDTVERSLKVIDNASKSSVDAGQNAKQML